MSEPKPAGPPLIGQFSGPENNAPREDLQRKEDVEAVEAIERQLSSEREKRKPKTQEEKAQAYAEGLETAGLEPKDARVVIDAMAEKGAYEEDYRIAGRISITLRSRDYGDVQRAMRYLEAENPTYMQSINDFISRYNLAASLKRYNEKVFEFPERTPENTNKVEQEFERRLMFLQTIPTPIVERMMQSLVAFDTKVGAALAEGAPEDF